MLPKLVRAKSSAKCDVVAEMIPNKNKFLKSDTVVEQSDPNAVEVLQMNQMKMKRFLRYGFYKIFIFSFFANIFSS